VHNLDGLLTFSFLVLLFDAVVYLAIKEDRQDRRKDLGSVQEVRDLFVKNLLTVSEVDAHHVDEGKLLEFVLEDAIHVHLSLISSIVKVRSQADVFG